MTLQRNLPRMCLNTARYSSLTLLLVLATTGCSNIFYRNSDAPTPTSAGPLTGNWQFDVTTTQGTAPFNQLTGAIDILPQAADGTTSATALLLAQPDSCFNGIPLLPLQGTLTTANLTLFSFSDTGQYLTMQVSPDATNTHLQGPFKITGGCADGTTGTLAGTKYAALTGTYAGPVTGNGNETLNLNLTQASADQGDGTFRVSGSATFAGIACFNKGTSNTTTTYVTGSDFQLTFTTNDPTGAQITLTGTMDPTAATLTVTQIAISSGACAGTLPGAQLLLATS